jgi:hypothetical protein
MNIDGHPVEILALAKAHCADPGREGEPLCLFTFRPESNMDRWVLMLTREQCVRIRDTLDDFLNDRESWLYVPKRRQREMRMT